MNRSIPLRPLPILLLLLLLGSSLPGYAQSPQWSVHPPAYEFTMNVTTALYVDAARSTGLADTLAAFVGPEVRGLAAPQLVNGQPVFFLTVYSNTSDERLTFKLYDAEAGAVLDVTETLTFANGAVYGSPATPFSLTAQNTGTSVEDPDEAVPHRLTLGHNYPNPFQTRTTVPFALPTAGSATLRVFTLTGSLVESVHLPAASAGWNTLSFEAGDLPSGLYLYQLQSGDTRLTRSMLLVR